MNIYLKKIDKTNYKECINLKLTLEQERYISSNLLSLVQTTYEDSFYSLGVYMDDLMVGFIKEKNFECNGGSIYNRF